VEGSGIADGYGFHAVAAEETHHRRGNVSSSLLPEPDAAEQSPLAQDRVSAIVLSSEKRLFRKSLLRGANAGKRGCRGVDIRIDATAIGFGEDHRKRVTLQSRVRTLSYPTELVFPKWRSGPP
jgi:hypothetical protein